MTSIVNRVFISGISLICASVLLNGCATGQKNLQPVSDQQINEQKAESQKKTDFIKGLEVVEQPALEPEWADYVKSTYPSWRSHYWVDRGNWGNRGYIVGGPGTNLDLNVVAVQPMGPAGPTPLVSNPPPNLPLALTDETPTKIETADHPTKYIVKKGDSLWKIAGKVYHNPLKWPRIYRANKEKIKHPNKIYPNQVLIIPWN